MPRSGSPYASIKEAVTRRDLGPALSYIKGLTAEPDFTVFREQKILLAARNRDDQQQLASAVLSVVTERLAPLMATEYERYVQFILLAADLLAEIGSEVGRLMQETRQHRLPQLLATLNAIAISSYGQQQSVDFENISETLRENQAITDREVDQSESMLHESAGALNDVLFAIARTASHLAREHRQGSIVSDDANTAKLLLTKLVFQASRSNAVEYLVDMVSYGEWTIDKISGDSPVVVQFGIRDPKLSKARLVALRRNAVAQRFNEPPSTRQASLITEIVHGIFISIVQTFRDLDSNIIPSSATQVEVQRDLATLIQSLGNDDWSLIEAARGDLRVMMKYIAGLTLRCTILAFDIAERVGKVGYNRLEASAILDEDFFSGIQLENRQLNSILQEEIRALLPDAASLRWADLLTFPFMRVRKRIVGLPALLVQNWADQLRASVATGAIGKQFGLVWEQQFERLFVSHGWDCTRGINIPASAHRPSTDADLIVTKDGVCLMIQVKAIAHSGFNTFQNWKARQAITKGVHQAVTATQKLRDDMDFRISVLGGRRARTIERFIPLVLTNAIVFSGWELEGVSILSARSLWSILTGGEVTFTRMENGIRSTRIGVPGVQLGEMELLGFLRCPVEWRLARETEAVEHHIRTEFRVHFSIPQLSTT